MSNLFDIPDGPELYASYDEKRAKMLERLPRCNVCDEPITDEEAIYYNSQYCCKNCEEYFWWDIREDFLVRIEIDD